MGNAALPPARIRPRSAALARPALVLTLVLAFVSFACGGSDERATEDPGAGGGGSGGGAEEPCAAPDPRCTPVGVPEGACAEGFASDDAGGCVPLLPAEPCEPGKMAAPGDASCLEPLPCDEGLFGGEPPGKGAVFVDRAYAGEDADGSETRPFPTIAAAIAAAPAGGVVAIREGRYEENVVLGGKPLRLRGACPARVEIAGASAAPAVFVQKGASGSELRGLAIRGPALGVLVSGAEDVRLEGLWIHDTGDAGLVAEDTLGPTGIEARDVLVESARDLGVLVLGPRAHLERLVVRGTRPRSGGKGGAGLSVENDKYTIARTSVTVRRSVFDQNRDVGVLVAGSDLAIEASVVRGTQPRQSDQQGGAGIAAQSVGSVGERAALSVSGSVVEHCRDVGVFVAGSDLAMDRTVVRDVLPRASDMAFGRGAAVQEGAIATIRDSLFERTHNAGIFVGDASASLEGVGITAPLAEPETGLFGDGLVVMSILADASASVVASRVLGATRAGISSFGSRVTVSRTALECNAFHLGAEPFAGRVPLFEDGGDNACGCESTSVLCRASSADLAPPEPSER